MNPDSPLVEIIRQELEMNIEDAIEQGYYNLLTGQGAEFIGRTPDEMLFKTRRGSFIVVRLRHGNGLDSIDLIQGKLTGGRANAD